MLKSNADKICLKSVQGSSILGYSCVVASNATVTKVIKYHPKSLLTWLYFSESPPGAGRWHSPHLCTIPLQRSKSLNYQLPAISGIKVDKNSLMISVFCCLLAGLQRIIATIRNTAEIGQ